MRVLVLGIALALQAHAGDDLITKKNRKKLLAEAEKRSIQMHKGLDATLPYQLSFVRRRLHKCTVENAERGLIHCRVTRKNRGGVFNDDMKVVWYADNGIKLYLQSMEIGVPRSAGKKRIPQHRENTLLRVAERITVQVYRDLSRALPFQLGAGKLTKDCAIADIKTGTIECDVTDIDRDHGWTEGISVRWMTDGTNLHLRALTIIEH